MSQSLLTTDGLFNVPDEPGVSGNGDIVMEPIDRLTEDQLLQDYEDSPNRIEPSQKPRSSRDKARPSGSEKNQYRNRQKDRTAKMTRAEETSQESAATAKPPNQRIWSNRVNRQLSPSRGILTKEPALSPRTTGRAQQLERTRTLNLTSSVSVVKRNKESTKSSY